MFSRGPSGRSGYSGRGSSSGDWDYRERKLDPKEELRQLAETDLESATKLAKFRGVALATIADVPALAKRQAVRETAARKRQEAQRIAEIVDKGKEASANLDRAASRAEMARHTLETGLLETDIDKHPLYLLRKGATDITVSLKELQSIASEVPEHKGIRDEIFFAASRLVRAAKGFLDCTTHHKLKDRRLGELARQINAFMRKMVQVGWDESSYDNPGHFGNGYQQQADQFVVSGRGRRFRNLLATVPVEHSHTIQQPSPVVQRSRALASRTIQRSSQNATKTAPATNSPPNSTIDSPQSAINKPGFIDNDDGSNIRTGPAELAGNALTAQPLPPATRVFVSGQHPEAPCWWYASAHLPDAIVRGYVQNFRVNTDLPEPSAKLYQIKSGDTVEALARKEFSASVRDGHDLRYYENVLLAVNRDKNRAGIKGTFQDPGIFGGGSNNIQLEAGRRIWLVSPAYARSLEGAVPDGSLTNGEYAKITRVLGHIEDLVQSVTDSPQYFGEVAGEYAEAIKGHLPEIIGITAGFILAESASAFLAATPTGVGQLAAVVIQLGLAAFGASFAIDAGIEALKHGQQWLTLAWTAKGAPDQLGEASKEFLKMLVSIATAALAILGVRGNVGKGLKIADSINIQPPKLGWSPAMVTPEGVVVPRGPVFTPGGIATTGPVDIRISAMTGAGSGGSRIKPEESKAGGSRIKPEESKAGKFKETRRTDNENVSKSGEDAAKGDAVEHTGSTRTVVNSGGGEVIRRTVSGHDELLTAAEKAAGGSLDKLKEFKPGWWEGIRPDGTRVKIEWETVGHTTTNEGPHVTVRVWDPLKGKKGGWRVIEKHFIEGQETLR